MLVPTWSSLTGWLSRTCWRTTTPDSSSRTEDRIPCKLLFWMKCQCVHLSHTCRWSGSRANNCYYTRKPLQDWSKPQRSPSRLCPFLLGPVYTLQNLDWTSWHGSSSQGIGSQQRLFPSCSPRSPLQPFVHNQRQEDSVHHHWSTDEIQRLAAVLGQLHNQTQRGKVLNFWGSIWTKCAAVLVSGCCGIFAWSSSAGFDGPDLLCQNKMFKTDNVEGKGKLETLN